MFLKRLFGFGFGLGLGPGLGGVVEDNVFEALNALSAAGGGVMVVNIFKGFGFALK